MVLMVKILKDFTTAQTGNTDQIKYLMNLEGDGNSKNIRDLTPVMAAASFAQDNVFQLLMQNGAYMSVTTVRGGSLLHFAAQGGSPNIIRELFSRFVDVDVKDISGETPLMTAASYGKKEVFDLLIEKKADPRLKDVYRFSLLHDAVLGDNISIIEKLLTLDLEINSTNLSGQTPLQLTRENYCETAEQFLLYKEAY